MDKKPIAECDKCNEVYFMIIFSCIRCYKKVADATGFNSNDSFRLLCIECYEKLYDDAWKYKQLSK